MSVFEGLSVSITAREAQSKALGHVGPLCLHCLMPYTINWPRGSGSCWRAAASPGCAAPPAGTRDRQTGRPPRGHGERCVQPPRESRWNRRIEKEKSPLDLDTVQRRPGYFSAYRRRHTTSIAPFPSTSQWAKWVTWADWVKCAKTQKQLHCASSFTVY